MEVDKVSFYPLLLDLLTDISEAHFVAFDLELSGVPTKKVKSDRGSGRPSLQERYLETKEAAEHYQILQIGLTCVQQDVKNGKYVLKPYNFEISPLIEERGLDVERIFSFQSGAVGFLLKAGFDISLPFNHGIPYLSRAETKEARDKFFKRQDKRSIADIDIKPTETESLAFLERVRSEIDAWLTSRAPETLEYVNIGKAKAEVPRVEDTGEGMENSQPPEALTRFEKRLVHQLVRSEYPTLVTISKRDFVQIVRFNKARADQIAADRLKELEGRINKQKGFRWVIEALHGGKISNIDLHECAKDPISGEKVFADMDEFKAQFHRAATLLRSNPRMLVGHNCFLDLVYLYRTFIGALPGTVAEFQRKLHNLWPQIVDTKYMSTHNCGDINPVSSLEQIAQQLSNEKTPILEIDKEHMKYSEVEALHEAGYDSFLTAQIAIRLSAKLEREGTYVDVNGAASEDNKAEKEISNGVNGVKLTETALESHTYHAANGTSPQGADEFIPSVEGGKWKRKGDPTLPAQDPDDPFEYNPKDLKHRHRDDEAEKTFEGGMPYLSSDFWRVYGNKLRVFGTDEGICALDGRSDLISDDDGIGQDGVGVTAV